MADQIPFQAVEFAENPEQRCACVLLIDTSASMGGEPIREVVGGLAAYFDELAADELARKRVEVAVVAFGGTVEVVQNFAGPADCYLPELTPGGMTPMGAAIARGLDLLEERKAIYRNNAIPVLRPWVFLITDGAPTDQWSHLVERVRRGEEAGSFLFFAVGTEGADFAVLNQLSARGAIRLKGLRFRDLFTWLSASQRSVSRSLPGQRLSLPPATGPDGWGEIVI